MGALAAVEMDRLAEATSLLEAGSEALASRRFWMMSHYYEWARGLVSWARGDLVEGTEILDAAGSRLMDLEMLPLAAHVLVDLAEIALGCGLPKISRGAARRLEEVSEELHRDYYRALAAIGAGWVQLATGAHEEAAQCGERAMGLLSGRGYRALEARALDLVGRAHARVDRRKGIATLGRAARLFDACSARWRLARTTEAMRRIGKPGRRAATALASVLAPSPNESTRS